MCLNTDPGMDNQLDKDTQKVDSRKHEEKSSYGIALDPVVIGTNTVEISVHFGQPLILHQRAWLWLLPQDHLLKQIKEWGKITDRLENSTLKNCVEEGFGKQERY